MRMNRTGMRVGATVLALALLAIPTLLDAQRATPNIARRLAGGLRPRSPAPPFRYIPGSPGETQLRREEEPHLQATIRRLSIRPGAAVSR